MEFHKMKMEAYEKAINLSKQHKNPFNQLKISSRMELLHYQNQGVKRVTILSAGGCENCKHQGGNTHHIQDALKEMPIPDRTCTYNLHKRNKKYCFCRCAYIPEVD